MASCKNATLPETSGCDRDTNPTTRKVSATILITMKFPRSLFLAATLGGLAIAVPTNGLAQTITFTDATLVPITVIGPFTASGTFRTSDGSKGNYTVTYSFSGATTTTTSVYTLLSSTQTSTDTTVTTNNLDGSRIVTFSHLGFGATVPFSSTTTYPTTIQTTAATVTSPKGTSGAVGTGTYTAADGTSGTLVSLLTHGNQEVITSTEYTSAVGVRTRELRIENNGGTNQVIRTLTVDSANALTATALTLFPGRHHDK